MSACFIVRAQVVDAALMDAFDRWFQNEHLRDAHKAFKARRAWRGWIDVDTNVLHYAIRVRRCGGGTGHFEIRCPQGHGGRVRPHVGRQDHAQSRYRGRGSEHW